MGKAKSNPEAWRKSVVNVLNTMSTNRERYNMMWNAAAKATFLTKKQGRDKETGKALPKKYNTAGNLIVKTNRLSRGHSYKILLSGAVAEAARVAKYEAQTMRIEGATEMPACPALPTMSDGAVLNLEHLLTAIAQTYFSRAVALKDAMPLSALEVQKGVQKKVTGKIQDEACLAVNDLIFAPTSLEPGRVRLFTSSVKPKSAKRKGKKSVAPAAPAAVEADA